MCKARTKRKQAIAKQMAILAAEKAAKPDTRIEGSNLEGIVGAAGSATLGVASIVLIFFINMSWISELFCMYGFLLGLHAISTYKSSALWQKVKPKATLFLGIIGTVLNSIAMLAWLFWIVGYFILLWS